MEPLITIETVPIKIEYVEKEPLRMSSVHSQLVDVTGEQGNERVESRPIRISVKDSFEPSSVYNWNNLTYTATAKYGDDGNLKLEVSMEDGEAKPIHFKEITRNIDHMADLLVSSEAQTGEDSASMEISFDMGGLPSGMPSATNQNIQFFPPDIELKMTQRPQVIIKYVGGPIYVPMSADPDYVRPEGLMEMPELAQGLKMDLKV
ncbi:hypothetical protein [Acetobacterium bakii]|uniref:Uncharacterized protein n=1 Tax=Acetobacterium bakii TaxID=52689 RepID=A0A0L6U2S1_9FIRM|nr:hypothetical protein [Acetobacterium bakii]KNZ42652.1 hypothetical protein AKG39_05810 [Acetobacterium bakii]